MEDFSYVQYPRYRLVPEPTEPTVPPLPNTPPYYNGTNTRLFEKSYCFNCLKTENISLLKCTRCTVAYYCSRDCQKQHFPRHKKACKRIGTIGCDVYEEIALVTPMSELCADFEPNSMERGFFVRAKVMHLFKRLSLANRIYDSIAWVYDTKDAWQVVEKLYSETQRLTEDVLEYGVEEDEVDLLELMDLDDAITWRYPFVLLYLNRDEDAAWYLLDKCPEWCSTEHIASGQYRFHDFYSELDENDEDVYYQETPLHFLLVLAIIKMRLVAAYKAGQQWIENVFQTTMQQLTPVQSIIAAMCLGDATVMEAQEAQLQRLLEIIQVANKTILPALLNPMPLLDQPDPGHRMSETGNQAEAFYTVKLAYRLWHRIPGAKELLEARFGVDPIYDTSLEDDSDEDF